MKGIECLSGRDFGAQVAHLRGLGAIAALQEGQVMQSELAERMEAEKTRDDHVNICSSDHDVNDESRSVMLGARHSETKCKG